MCDIVMCRERPTKIYIRDVHNPKCIPNLASPGPKGFLSHTRFGWRNNNNNNNGTGCVPATQRRRRRPSAEKRAKMHYLLVGPHTLTYGQKATDTNSDKWIGIWEKEERVSVEHTSDENSNSASLGLSSGWQCWCVRLIARQRGGQGEWGEVRL